MAGSIERRGGGGAAQPGPTPDFGLAWHVGSATLNRARGIVAVGDRGAEGGVEVAAFIAEGQIDQHGFIAGQHALHPAEIGVDPGSTSERP